MPKSGGLKGGHHVSHAVSWNRCKILIKTESCDSFDCGPLSWFKADMKLADKPKRVFSQRRRCNGLKRGFIIVSSTFA